MKDIEMSDDQLIFLISLPRSGSTMLQKILGAHTDIYTRSEPWLMLHPLYMLKSEDIEACYNVKLANEGVRNFIGGLPGDGENFYYQKQCECYLSLYDRYLRNSTKQRFLDKTPRYYLIYDELQKTFPNARFIILYRNPVAVLASIIDTWVKECYESLSKYRCDLEKGVEFLQRDFSNYSNTYLVRYEDILANPEKQIKKIFNFLQLEDQPECIEYGKNPSQEWQYGDQKTIYKKNRPDLAHAMRWVDQLENQEVSKLCYEYIQLLGKNAFNKLGYSYEDTLKKITDSFEEKKGYITDSLVLKNYLYSDTKSLNAANERNALLQEKVGKLSNSLEEKRVMAKGLLEQLKMHQGLVLSRDKQIEELKNKVQQQKSQLEEKRVMAKGLLEQLKMHQGLVLSRDKQIEELKNKVQQQKSQI